MANPPYPRRRVSRAANTIFYRSLWTPDSRFASSGVTMRRKVQASQSIVYAKMQIPGRKWGVLLLGPPVPHLEEDESARNYDFVTETAYAATATISSLSFAFSDMARYRRYHAGRRHLPLPRVSILFRPQSPFPVSGEGAEEPLFQSPSANLVEAPGTAPGSTTLIPQRPLAP